MEIIAQTSLTNSTLILNPPWCWFLFGLFFCGLEYYFRKSIDKAYRFIALMIGSSSVLMGFILWRLETKLDINWPILMQQEGALSLQIFFWMGLTFTFVFWIRPMFYRVKRKKRITTNEGETLTEIRPNQTGRVLYEGCSWQACCEGYQDTIAPHQKVYVIHRQDNMLFVIPAVED